MQIYPTIFFYICYAIGGALYLFLKGGLRSMGKLLKSWIFWIFIVAAALFGWQLVLWLLNKTSVTRGVASIAEKATGTDATI